MTRWSTILRAAVLAATPMMGSASETTPVGPVLLQLEVLGVEDATLQLDLSTLHAMPSVTFETATIWTDGLQQFTGVSLATLIQELGVNDGVLEAYAINAYVVEIPVSDAVEGGPIVAYERNGKEMSVRDKGPLWIVYPYDSDPAYRNEAIYSRSIWQLERIVINSTQ